VSGGGRQKVRIGELLVSKGIITEEQLGTALAEQKKAGLKLGRMLVELDFVEEDRLLGIIAEQLRVRFVDLRKMQLDPQLARMLPEVHARRFRAIVIEDRQRELFVAMADPSDVAACDELTRILKRRVRPAIARESDLIQLIDRAYRSDDELANLAVQLDEDLSQGAFDLARLAESTSADDTPVVRLLQSLFEDAVRVGASDIHIEPDESVLRIRRRIDGVLHEQVMRETRIASALVLRLKLMASLDIAERRRPQDGRFNVKLDDRGIDVRLSTMPVQHGESVVMRLLDHSQGTANLDELGLPAEMLERIRQIIHRPHGLVLVTGPTGSGKTTTLYAALGELNQAEKKIITIEDPVEYRLPRVNQVQVHPKIDVTFATVLRAALRQDPDILMVGEMRDTETVEMAVRAAMTGHLVLSTLHTNDAMSSGTRLIEMGCEGYLTATALRAVVAQRLVRIVCRDCSEPHEPTARERIWLSSLRPDFEADFVVGAGCSHCGSTGYRGRLGVYELLEFDGRLAEALASNDAAQYARAARETAGFRPLVDCALDRAAEGRTTLEEVFRVAGELEAVA
jgi:MSHA biogenesis protein MshE